MYLLLDSLAILCLSAFAFSSIRSVGKGNYDPHNALILAHFFFCGIPLILDNIIGVPVYDNQPGFYSARHDDQTNFVYLLYICFVPMIWKLAANRNTLRITPTSVYQLPTVPRIWKSRRLIYILLYSIFPLVLFSPNASSYFVYGAALHESSAHVSDYHQYIALVARISVVFSFLILSSAPRLNFKLIILNAVPVFASIWVQGKRSMVAITIALVFFLISTRGFKSTRMVLVFTVLATLLLFIFSFSYQSNVRNINVFSNQRISVYDNFRIDFGRDDVIRMSIYSYIHPDDMNILEYPGQSVVFYFSSFIPRSFWPGKPLPYAQYFTSAMLNSSPRMWGWGMTTSWLDESISNFGFMGFLLGPIFLSLIARIGNRQQNKAISILASLICVLFLSVQMIVFLPLLVIWAVLVYFERRTAKAVSRYRYQQ